MPQRDEIRAKRDEIRAIPVFEDLDERTQDLLAGLARTRKFESGQEIFAEGDTGTGFHVVAAGRVKVYKLSPGGREQILHVWGPGEPFGEVAVFEGGAFPAHASALEPTRTLFFPRAGLVELIRAEPEFALRWLAVLSRRLRRFAVQVEALTLREVPERLAAWLLLLDEEQGGHGEVTLDLAKNQLANLLGATPETFSRVLARLAKEGLVETRGRALTILDAEALADVADGRRRLG